jgi:hypothetical protein
MGLANPADLQPTGVDIGVGGLAIGFGDLKRGLLVFTEQGFAVLAGFELLVASEQIPIVLQGGDIVESLIPTG